MLLSLDHNKNLSKHSVIFFAIIACLCYGYVGYFLARSDFYTFISLACVLFLASYFTIKKSGITFQKLFILSIIYRLLFLFSIPNLSQDFFRFFWDGQLTLQGINPFVENVVHYFSSNQAELIKNSEVLRQGMGELNASHYSNYPPVSQAIYAVSAWFSQGSIMGFIISTRLILICFDVLFIYFARKLLLNFNQNPKQLFWYILNPLCIIETTANLHFEGVMISLFIVAIYFFIKHKTIFSAFFLSLSISTKLLSLIFLPVSLKYFFKTFQFPKALGQGFIFGVFTILFLGLEFAFFFDDKFLNNFSESIGLWFGKFEFNASIFYLVRWIGYQFVGWNIIHTYGWVMPIISLLVFISLIYKQKSNPQKMLETMMWMLVIYFLLSTTVHPWYILFPLAMSVFTRYSFVFLWSFLVILSYSAYRNTEFNESMTFIIFQYSILTIFLLYEVFIQKNMQLQIQK